jgi:putative ABC transport system permease protein
MHAGWASRVALRAAATCLRHHRWRSGVTLVVCGLGTAGVIAAGLLARANIAEVQERFRALGGGLIVVSPNKLPPFPGRPRQLDHFISLEPHDGAALRDRLPQLRAVVPVVARSTTARLEGTTARIRLVGVGPAFFQVRNFALHQGRFLQPADGAERVAILGHAVSHELVPGGVPPGQEIYVGTIPFQVIGSLRPQGVNFAGEDEDHQVFIPLDTFRRRVANRPWLHHFYIQLAPEADSAQAVRQIQDLLRDRHSRWSDQVDDAIVRDLADLAARESSLLATTTWTVSLISGLLLVVGAAGIASLMILIVRERQTEIALRRAVGATPVDVALQFFLEGILLAASGVLAGLALGGGGALLLAYLLPPQVQLDAGLVLSSAAISLTFTAVASALPAMLAARTEPARFLSS